jgi:hypothetical protein
LSADADEKGQNEFLQPLIDSGKVQVVCEQYTQNWDPTLAQSFAEDCLTRNGGDVDVFLGMNDGTTGGAVAALINQGLKPGQKLVTGGQDATVEALRYIAQGWQDNLIPVLAAFYSFVPSGRANGASSKVCASASTRRACFAWTGPAHRGPRLRRRRPPKVDHSAVDFQIDLVQMPSPVRLQATLPQICSDHRSEMIHPAPNRFVG